MACGWERSPLLQAIDATRRRELKRRGRTSQFSRSVDPSALLRGRATKPMGWSLRQLRRSSRRRPSAMPAIFFRGVRAGSPRSSRRCWWFASRRANWVLGATSAAVVATVPVAVLPSHTGPGGSARKIELAQYWAQRWHFTSPRAHLDGSAWAVFLVGGRGPNQRDTY